MVVYVNTDPTPVCVVVYVNTDPTPVCVVVYVNTGMRGCLCKYRYAWLFM